MVKITLQEAAVSLSSLFDLKEVFLCLSMLKLRAIHLIAGWI